MPRMKEGLWLIRNQMIQHPSEGKEEGAARFVREPTGTNRVAAPECSSESEVKAGARLPLVWEESTESRSLHYPSCVYLQSFFPLYEYTIPVLQHSQ